MSEIYINTSQFVYLDVYGGVADDTPAALFVMPDGTSRALTVNQDTPPTGVDDRYHVVLTMADTQNEGDIEINWSFTMAGQPVSKTDYLSVVTPILTFSEIKQIHPNATDDEVSRIESAVRNIIQELTGQSFGQYTGIKEVKGTDSKLLNLPARLQSITDINNDTTANNYYTIEGDGYFLRYYSWGVPPIKADYYGLHHFHGVIQNPDCVSLDNFFKSQTYRINGVWGWKKVPTPIKEAAKLLVNDYACSEISFRDRYLTSMTAADWRIQFNPEAFIGTGNVRADQLIRDYVLKRGWAVL